MGRIYSVKSFSQSYYLVVKVFVIFGDFFLYIDVGKAFKFHKLKKFFVTAYNIKLAVYYGIGYRYVVFTNNFGLVIFFDRLCRLYMLGFFSC